MVPFEKALKTILSKAGRLPSERVSLSDVSGRVLAADIVSDIDMPRHDVSAMDGYACRKADLDMQLAVIETIPAGKMPTKTVRKGQCARIMTGAPVPRGADTVVKFEDTKVNGSSGSIRIAVRRGNPNIRRRGEDVRRGTVVLQKGTMVTPSTVAVLAAVGISKAEVARRPRVGIIATGDELVEPHKKPTGGQTRNSNGWQLAAQVRETGGISRYYGIVKDDPAALDRTIRRSLRECDAVMISGGVSMGDFDFVPDVFRNNGIRIMFEKIAMKPGKPTVFGTRGGKAVFGIPGNPVSAFVVFEMLVKPFLWRMAGHRYVRPAVRCTLTKTIARKNASRLEFRPVQFKADGSAALPDYHGPAHIHAYTHADGIIAIPSGVSRIKSGTRIKAALL